jgi:hypothetical protein
MITSLKQSLETVLASNITAANFKDTLEVAKIFECQSLIQSVLRYAKENI